VETQNGSGTFPVTTTKPANAATAGLTASVAGAEQSKAFWMPCNVMARTGPLHQHSCVILRLLSVHVLATPRHKSFCLALSPVGYIHMVSLFAQHFMAADP